MKFLDFLLPQSTNLEGCEVLFPESVFFDAGKPYFIAMTDKDGKMKS